MDRFRPQLLAVFLVAAAALALATGCNAVATAWWVIKDGKTALAEYKGLDGKKVAVVVRAPSQAMFRQQQNVSFQMAKGVNRLLKMNLSKKTQIIAAEKVEKVKDAGEWSEFTEIGKQLNAEQLVAIELDEFNPNAAKSSTIHSGTASLTIYVYDMADPDGEPWTKRIRDIQFPPTTGGQWADTMKPKQFQDMFIYYLCDQVGRNFYDYDPRADFAGWGLGQ